MKAKRAMSDTDDETWTEGVAPTLNAFDNGSESRATVLVFAANQRDEVRELRVAGALSAEPGMKQQTFLAFHMTQDPISGHVSPALGAGSGDGGFPTTGVMESAGVRRLTPRECERLQGWPDDHTRWDADGNELPDSFRYRACGNGVAAPVAEWIATRLQEAAS